MHQLAPRQDFEADDFGWMLWAWRDPIGAPAELMRRRSGRFRRGKTLRLYHEVSVGKGYRRGLICMATVTPQTRCHGGGPIPADRRVALGLLGDFP